MKFLGDPNTRQVVIGNDDGTVTPLPHLMRHSPDGFAWGYGGSGPSDLARSIVGYLREETDPNPLLYMPVKQQFIAHEPMDEPLVIDVDEVLEFMSHWTVSP